MEKLIELVYYYNSHLEKDKIWIWLTTSVKEDGREVPFDKEKEIRKYENYIISKKYWFIERLVENDKIDIEKLNILKEPFVEAYYYHHLKSPKDCANWLIMILSIIYNPIGYLCKILK